MRCVLCPVGDPERRRGYCLPIATLTYVYLSTFGAICPPVRTCSPCPLSQADQQYAERLSRLIERIETFIDPFDFDVFAPFLQERLTRQLQRCQVSLSGGRHRTAAGLSSARQTVIKPSLDRPPSDHHQTIFKTIFKPSLSTCHVSLPVS